VLQASLAGLVVSFIACFILLVIAPLVSAGDRSTISYICPLLRLWNKFAISFCHEHVMQAITIARILLDTLGVGTLLGQSNAEPTRNKNLLFLLQVSK